MAEREIIPQNLTPIEEKAFSLLDIKKIGDIGKTETRLRVLDIMEETVQAHLYRIKLQNNAAPKQEIESAKQQELLRWAEINHLPLSHLTRRVIMGAVQGVLASLVVLRQQPEQFYNVQHFFESLAWQTPVDPHEPDNLYLDTLPDGSPTQLSQLKMWMRHYE